MVTDRMLKDAKKQVAERAGLWDIALIKGAALLWGSPHSVIRRLFFCPGQMALRTGGQP